MLQMVDSDPAFFSPMTLEERPLAQRKNISTETKIRLEKNFENERNTRMNMGQNNTGT